MPDTCPEQVAVRGLLSARSHACGRPIKRDGLCGLHAAAKERREAKMDAWDRKRAQQEALVRRVQKQIEGLAAIGVRASLHYDPVSGYTGRVIVDAEQVVTALANPQLARRNLKETQDAR